MSGIVVGAVREPPAGVADGGKAGNHKGCHYNSNDDAGLSPRPVEQSYQLSAVSCQLNLVCDTAWRYQFENALFL